MPDRFQCLFKEQREGERGNENSSFKSLNKILFINFAYPKLDIFNNNMDSLQQVFWEEPIFADNVKITHVMASKLPGYPLKQGRHDVLYQAADEDGNKARCVFTVHVLNENQMPSGVRR